MYDSVLYPITNSARMKVSLDGLWKFSFDKDKKGIENNWMTGLDTDETMPVPGSFASIFSENEKRNYCGDFWYETEFDLPDFPDKDLVLRFGSVTHRCEVYLNGNKIGEHEGGFLPFALNITDKVKRGKNLVVVRCNNELNEESLPCGTVKKTKDKGLIAKPYFDFFNYSGIQRDVDLLILPKIAITDYSISYEIKEDEAIIQLEVYTSKESSDISAFATFIDETGDCVSREELDKISDGFYKKEITISNPVLWNVLDPHLYNLQIELNKKDNILDIYEEKVGIRTLSICGSDILINNKKVFLKGYGKHEDFSCLGRSFNYSVAKKDFSLMKWNNANCFRTSHYPYDERWYKMADEEGFLIIDELPAVGMMRSTHNFVDAGMEKYTYFFETPTVPKLQENHIKQTRELIKRDKNHPSVIAFSLFNEPETTSDYSYEYFKKIFDEARSLDPQKRPLTGALEKNSSPEKCKCYKLLDFISLNRYYGWYISGGELDEAEAKFRDELDRWKNLNTNKPFIMTEFGTDTMPGYHSVHEAMWSEEYQKAYYEMNFKVLDDYDFIQGELVWNFADFMTSEGIFRVGGNKKGIFTRDREPKSAAFVLKDRWANK